MKYIILLFFSGCLVKQPQSPAPAPTVVYSVKDTCIADPVIHDTVLVTKVIKEQVVCTHQKTIDSLRSKLFLANYKVERVRYYLKIAIRKPSQDKFLKSWISRAVK